MKKTIDYNLVIDEIQNKVKDYLIKCNLQSLIIGVSGGFDSGLGCALLAPVCKELGIPLIGRYIHVESNSKEEKERAIAIGDSFCTNFKCKDLTMEYHHFLHKAEETSIFGGYSFLPSKDQKDKIRRGNVKVRMRIMYLYNLSQHFNGIVVGCNNLTEYSLGFFTLGDSGDINPFISLYKTELYELAKVYMDRLKSNTEKKALQAVIDAVPTDGLGISSSDVEQFGVKTYSEVDDILISLTQENFEKELYPILCEKYTQEAVDKVVKRKVNSEFKRNHPHKIIIE